MYKDAALDLIDDALDALTTDLVRLSVIVTEIL